MLDMYKAGPKHPNAAPWPRFVTGNTTYQYVDMYGKRSRTTHLALGRLRLYQNPAVTELYITGRVEGRGSE
jgi:hypothetical protein